MLINEIYEEYKELNSEGLPLDLDQLAEFQKVPWSVCVTRIQSWALWVVRCLLTCDVLGPPWGGRLAIAMCL